MSLRILWLSCFYFRFAAMETKLSIFYLVSKLFLALKFRRKYKYKIFNQSTYLILNQMYCDKNHCLINFDNLYTYKVFNRSLSCMVLAHYVSNLMLLERPLMKLWYFDGNERR